MHREFARTGGPALFYQIQITKAKLSMTERLKLSMLEMKELDNIREQNEAREPGV